MCPAPHMHRSPIINNPHQSGMFVTTDEPTLDTSKSAKAHSFHCGLLLMYLLWVWTMECIQHSSLMQSIFTVLKSSVLHLFIPASPHPLVTAGLFTASTVLPFPECHTVENHTVCSLFHVFILKQSLCPIRS